MYLYGHDCNSIRKSLKTFGAEKLRKVEEAQPQHRKYMFFHKKKFIAELVSICILLFMFYFCFAFVLFYEILFLKMEDHCYRFPQLQQTFCRIGGDSPQHRH